MGSWSWREALAEAASEGYFISQADLAELDAGLPSGMQRSTRRDVLRPRPANEGRRGTFTSNHGFGGFPWHTDGAIADEPPRFILLSSPVASDTPTELLRLSRGVPVLEALRGLVLFTRHIRPRYFRAVDTTQDMLRVRWDPDKLTVVSPSPPEFATLPSSPDARIEWREGTVALIDNWRCLHRRPQLSDGDKGRVLFRTYIHGRLSSV